MDNYSSIVVVRPRIAQLDTTALFDRAHVDANLSPVDQFLDDSETLNRHWVRLPPADELAPELGRLLLLGYVSAVEGYMRALIRRLVAVDLYTRHQCEPLTVSYGAVLHHESSRLPDALLEETVFSIEGAITKALGKFVGHDALPKGTKDLLAEFERICQLRHCCTHRFGRLGVKNALALGLSEHGHFLEMPIRLGKEAMADIADLTFTLVKSINNDVYGFVLRRTVLEPLPGRYEKGIGWTWNKRHDRQRFKVFYDVFSSTKDATPSPPADRAYEFFRTEHQRMTAKKAVMAAAAA